MKKTIIRYYVILLIAYVLLSGLPQALAQNATTEAEVEFTAGEGPTGPVDPDDPGTDANTGIEVTGSLAIVSVSNFDFGSVPVTVRSGLYDITTIRPNIQVVDLRGTGTGWSVSASVSRFESGGSYSLPGAAIYIYNGRPNSLSSSPAPAQAVNLKLTTDGEPAAVVTAQNGAGMGMWAMRWYPDPAAEGAAAFIQLEVPAGTASAGSHTATINWVLKNTP